MTERIAPLNRRLNPTYKPQSKWVSKNPDEAKEKAKRLADLEKKRNEVFALVSKYTNRLSSKTLPDTMSRKEKEEQHQLPQLLIDEAKNLNLLNVDEGNDVLLAVCLHTMLRLKDEINVVSYQNLLLSEEIKKLKNEPK